MNPRAPDLLSRIVGQAERTLDQPTGDARRQDTIEKLIEEVAAAQNWGTEHPPRVVNEWTEMLVKMLRKIEREGPLGSVDVTARAMQLGHVLLDFVRRDLARALDELAAQRPATTEQERNRAR